MLLSIMPQGCRCITTVFLVVALSLSSASTFSQSTDLLQSTERAAHPGARNILDTHNCYPDSNGGTTGSIARSPLERHSRWWNNAWRVMESAVNAGAWTADKEARLIELVRYAHQQNLWIRFYTLGGASPGELGCRGWFRTYNFGSKQAAVERWKAARRAGVDFIATDQYEELAEALRPR